MKDLKFEQKSSLSRIEAADRLAALAAALRDGGEAELKLGSGTTLGLRIPDDLRTELEIEIGDGEVELEIEFKWSTTSGRAPRTTPSQPGATAEKPAGAAAEKPASATAEKRASATAEKPARKKSVPAKSGRSGTGTRRARSG
ncbi:amphi-Trp domain-containing protein [Streptomyces griseorubiginosus]|uniref:amphi-Trp domain-containing protein n=1 Tax=Streptomyces griseorubiginosus TaxID=67304 RepID=UPI0036F0D54C